MHNDSETALSKLTSQLIENNKEKIIKKEQNINEIIKEEKVEEFKISNEKIASILKIPQNESENLANLNTKPYLTIFHNDHFDFLIDGYLYYYKPNGGVQIHELEISEVNPNECSMIEEISHIKDFQELENKYKLIISKLGKKITMDSLIFVENCHSLNCNCTNNNYTHNFGKKILNKNEGENNSKAETIETSNNEFFTFGSEDETQLNNNNINKNNNNYHNCCRKICNNVNHECFCKITQEFKHKHSINCEHEIIYHNGHIDYVVDNVLHFPHGNHCDNHGRINVIDIF